MSVVLRASASADGGESDQRAQTSRRTARTNSSRTLHSPSIHSAHSAHSPPAAAHTHLVYLLTDNSALQLYWLLLFIVFLLYNYSLF